MNDIKVSVIIPVYNAAAFLDDCLGSLLSQTLREIEVIAVNDGSSDSSLEILRGYEAADTRLKVIDQPNAGAGNARNTGLAAASGEYLSFLDADDIYEIDMLEKAYRAAADSDSDLCVFAADLFDNETGERRPCTWSFRREYFTPGEAFDPHDESYAPYIFQMFNGWPWDKLYRRSMVEKYGLRYQELRSTNDMYFVYMAEALSGRIITLDECLIHQRVSVSTSISRNRDKSWDCFYLGLAELKKGLLREGLYRTYRRSFRNWALNFTLWQLRTMHGAAYERAFALMKEKGLRELELSTGNRKYYYNRGEFSALLRLREYDAESFSRFLEHPQENGSTGLGAGRRLMICLRENGPVYTVRHLFGKVKSRLKKQLCFGRK